MLENNVQTVDIRVDHHHIVNMMPIYVPAFSVAEIRDITDNFSHKYLIAEGSGGGRVFHRVLKSGQDAAIKLLHSNLSDHEFIAQVWHASTTLYIYTTMERSSN